MQQSMKQSQIMITSPCPKLQFNIFRSLGEKNNSFIPLRSVNPRNCSESMRQFNNFGETHGEVPTSLISRVKNFITPWIKFFVDFISPQKQSSKSFFMQDVTLSLVRCSSSSCRRSRRKLKVRCREVDFEINFCITVLLLDHF